jgi:hypothetical protein
VLARYEARNIDVSRLVMRPDRWGAGVQDQPVFWAAEARVQEKDRTGMCCFVERQDECSGRQGLADEGKSVPQRVEDAAERTAWEPVSRFSEFEAEYSAQGEEGRLVS